MTSLETFQQRLTDELSAYAAQQLATVEASYGAEAGKACQRLFDEVGTDTGRWCGLLTLVGYKFEGGTHPDMIIQAARAMEVMHASARLFDAGDAEAAQMGTYMAEITLANLEDAAETDRLKVLSILNRSSLLRLNGKTAHYEFLNPMHVGMVLAGADCHATDDITPFMQALGAGDTTAARQLAADLAGSWPTQALVALCDLQEARLANIAVSGQNSANVKE
ncbi:MAG: polyprenyl synthetase family protein [Candidatus Saccharibacteria bacterium]|nr:polyprenyl synthetase family protein [Candidatus Saccharibacteria bacterium]